MINLVFLGQVRDDKILEAVMFKICLIKDFCIRRSDVFAK